jgi:hypothetical protein
MNMFLGGRVKDRLLDVFNTYGVLAFTGVVAWVMAYSVVSLG